MIRFVALLLGLALASACTLTLPTYRPDAPRAAHNDEASIGSNNLKRRFERAIADRVLADLPPIPTLRSPDDTAALIQQLDSVVNGARLDLSLLTRDQRQAMLAARRSLQQLKADAAVWQCRNPLTDYDWHHERTDKSREILTANLDDQQQEGRQYPRQLLESYRTQYPGLESRLESLPVSDDLSDWLTCRWTTLFSDAEAEALLELLERAEESASQRFTQTERNTDYQNPKYDIQREATPRQLALDILSLHIEEAAAEYDLLPRSINIEGETNAHIQLFNVREQTLKVDLASLVKLPAFELQTIAYILSGHLAPIGGNFVWRETLQIALGHWIARQLASDKRFIDRESELGHEVRQALLLSLGITELKLGLGHWQLSEARQYLNDRLPYTPAQIEQLLMALLDTHGSYAAAAHLIVRQPQLDINQLQSGFKWLEETPQPRYLPFLDVLSAATDSTGA